MTAKEKAVNQYIRDKHTQEECAAYIDGWQDAYMEGYNASETKAVKAMYWILTLGIIIGIILTLIFTLI
jgi:hypothetical protein